MLHTILFAALLVVQSPQPPPDPPAPWETVVRIHCGNSIRSGVIIQSSDRSSVAITCGHGWRGLSKYVEVDLFDGVIKGRKPAQVAYRKTCEGEIILLDEKADYAYIRFWPDELLPVSPVAKAWNPQIDEELITVGSSEGHDPTVWTTYVEIIERNAVRCAHPPKSGRSGGGLFNLQWELVGICVGRYDEEKMGHYIRLKPPPTKRR